MYCFYSNRILLNDKGRQVHVVGCAIYTQAQYSKMAHNYDKKLCRWRGTARRAINTKYRTK